MKWALRSTSPLEPSGQRSSSGAGCSRAGLRAARSTPLTTGLTLSPSQQSRPEPSPSPLSSRSSWSKALWVASGLSLWSGLRGPLLTLLVLLTLASAPGCCSEPQQVPVTLPAPLFPPGRPQDRTASLDRLLSVADLSPSAWDLVGEILADRAEWQAWAQALEAAGRWRR